MNSPFRERLFRLSPTREPVLKNADAIVAHIEVNRHHGVGVLLERLFGGAENILSIRSRDLYGGRQDFGALRPRIAQDGHSRDQVLWTMLCSLRGATVRRILCAPYYPDDALNAIALKDLFGVPLCTYLMDDQNLNADGIPDALIAELLEKSSLRLAISPEMADGYERKFGVKLWRMPPVVPERFIPAEVNRGGGGEPVIVGNIWGRQWVQLLRETVRGSGIALKWHNNGEFPWLPCSRKDLAADGIFPQETALDDEQLVEILRAAPYVVLPSGTLNADDDRRFIAQLSFPSRIPFILATAHAPILVLGHPETAAARFVRRAEIGMTVPYERTAFLRAVREITAPETNRRMRQAALRVARRFSDRGAAEWIWESLARGGPADMRYQDGV